MLMKQIAEGREPTIVSAEFLGDAAGPGLAERLTEDGVDRSIVRIDPIEGLTQSDGAPDWAGLVDRVVTDLLAGNGSSFIVAGYCSAGPFARDLAFALADRGADLRGCVLLGPSIPDLTMLVDQCDKLCEKLDGVGGQASAPAPGTTIDELLPTLLDMIEKRVIRFAHSVEESSEEAAIVAEMLTNRYQGWLHFLAASASGGRKPPACPEVWFVVRGGVPATAGTNFDRIRTVEIPSALVATDLVREAQVRSLVVDFPALTAIPGSVHR